jgi:hypothetical protein
MAKAMAQCHGLTPWPNAQLAGLRGALPQADGDGCALAVQDNGAGLGRLGLAGGDAVAGEEGVGREAAAGGRLAGLVRPPGPEDQVLPQLPGGLDGPAPPPERRVRPPGRAPSPHVGVRIAFRCAGHGAEARKAARPGYTLGRRACARIIGGRGSLPAGAPGAWCAVAGIPPPEP